MKQINSKKVLMEQKILSGLKPKPKNFRKTWIENVNNEGILIRNEDFLLKFL